VSSLFRTQFTHERELPPYPNRRGELMDQDPEEVSYTVVWYVEPAQNGGRTDPSWKAQPVMESILDEHGNLLATEDDGSIEVNRAEDAMNAAFNAMLSADDSDREVDPYDD